MEECQYMIYMKQLGFSMRKMIFPSVTQVTQKKKIPVFQKADLDSMIFPCTASMCPDFMTDHVM